MPTDALDPAELKLARTSPFHSIDVRFGIILGVSVVTHVAFAWHLHAQPLPTWSELVEPEPPHAGLRLPPLQKIPKAPPMAHAPQRGTRVSKSAPEAPVNKPRADLSKFGMLAVLQSHGEAKSRFDDVIDQAQGLDAHDAFEHASGVKAASLSELPRQVGPREGQVATIGRFGADQAGEVRLGEHQDSLVHSVVTEEPPEPKPGVDPQAVVHFLAARRRAVTLCYEHELKHFPRLAGRLVVRMTVSPSGRTSDVEIDENTLHNDAVARCVSTLIRGWTFPVRPDDEWTFSIPYIFSAGT